MSEDETEKRPAPTEGDWEYGVHVSDKPQYGVWLKGTLDGRLASMNGDIDPNEQKANARLMAASKDLLEACETAAIEVEALRDMLTDVTEWAEVEATLVEIKAAIAKAKGQS